MKKPTSNIVLMLAISLLMSSAFAFLVHAQVPTASISLTKIPSAIRAPRAQ